MDGSDEFFVLLKQQQNRSVFSAVRRNWDQSADHRLSFFNVARFSGNLKWRRGASERRRKRKQQTNYTFVIPFVVVLWIMPRRAWHLFPSILSIGFSCYWILTTSPPYLRLSACGSIIQLIRGGLSYAVRLFKEALKNGNEEELVDIFVFVVYIVFCDSRRGTTVFIVV